MRVGFEGWRDLGMKKESKVTVDHGGPFAGVSAGRAWSFLVAGAGSGGGAGGRVRRWRGNSPRKEAGK